jgi:hypothetical protein
MPFPDYESDTTVDSILYVMTSEEELSRLLSSYGTREHIDDLDELSQNNDPLNGSNTNSVNVIAEWCQRVTSQIMEYLSPIYHVKDVYKLPRIREIATYWLAYKLTGRRGNEPLYTTEYIEGIDTLEKYRSGELTLQAPTFGPRAYMQSGVVDLRATLQPYRIIPEASTRVLSSQKLFRWYGFNWL